MIQFKSIKQTGMLLIGAYLLSSCASLSKSQLNEVNQFGQSAKVFSAFPQKVMTTLVEVHTQNQYFQIGIIDSAEIHRRSVDSLYDWIAKSAKGDTAIGLTYQIIGDYGQKLVHLTSDIHTLQLDTAAQSFGTNLDDLATKFNSIEPGHKVPTGWGALIGEFITAGGNIYIQDRQAKGAKAFVAKGDTLISAITDKIEQVLQSEDFISVKSRISQERKHLVRNYTRFLQSNNELIKVYLKTDVYKKDKAGKLEIAGKKDTVVTGSVRAWRSSGIGADSLYLKLLFNLDQTEILRQQCVTAIVNLRKAHHKLLEDLQKKKNLTEVYTEMQQYGNSLNQMYSTFKKIK